VEVPRRCAILNCLKLSEWPLMTQSGHDGGIEAQSIRPQERPRRSGAFKSLSLFMRWPVFVDLALGALALAC
jgi:hypothetical protein